ncbi:hypothetical protein [Streptomyces sp. MNP-20]|uniref:hypothetical protein n=1 Tax=Streptomyces sp. MNP-20 TaxID=2721165 RepID=UPI001557DD19|nr:hypothetical protein [Streptomyces sp. MNP-20]
MRQFYVSVRWAATVVAVAATAGCMSIGDDGSGAPVPGKSVKERGGAAAPDGGTVLPGDERGRDDDGGRGGGHGKGKKGKGKRGDKGEASPEARGDDKPGSKPSRAGSGTAAASVEPTKNGRPTPTRTKPGPRPTRTTPTPDPTPEPPTPSPDPTTPEPSSSAHGEAEGPVKEQGEPSPEAGPA